MPVFYACCGDKGKRKVVEADLDVEIDQLVWIEMVKRLEAEIRSKQTLLKVAKVNIRK